MKFVWRHIVPDTHSGFVTKYWRIPTLPIQKNPYEGLELSWLSLLRRHFSTQGEIYTRIVFRSTLIFLRLVTVYRTYIVCTCFFTLCVYSRRKHAITSLDAWLLIMNCRLVWEITYLEVVKEMERVIMLNCTSTTLIFYVSAICFIATKHALGGILYHILTFD